MTHLQLRFYNEQHQCAFACTVLAVRDVNTAFQLLGDQERLNGFRQEVDVFGMKTKLIQAPDTPRFNAVTEHARALISIHGVDIAMERALSNIDSARRGRDRERGNYWLNVLTTIVEIDRESKISTGG